MYVHAHYIATVAIKPLAIAKLSACLEIGFWYSSTIDSLMALLRPLISLAGTVIPVQYIQVFADLHIQHKF